MVVPAMQLASKIPDMSVQLWSSALLKGTQCAFSWSVTYLRAEIMFYHVLEWKLWPCVLLADLNKALGNSIDAHEAAQMHQNFSQQLLQDHIAACSLPEHNLISVCETVWRVSRIMYYKCQLSLHTIILYISLWCFKYLLQYLFSSFPVDWRPSSRPDPSTERPNHQSCQPAMRDLCHMWH